MLKLRKILSLVLLTFSLSTFAGDFTELPARNYPVTDRLPVFSTQMKAGSAAGSKVAYRLDFPEYVRLSAEEVARIKKNGLHAPEEIEVRTSFAVSRKERYADISFCPIICREGTWLRLVSAKITPSILPTVKAEASTSPTERYADNSVLRTGKWVKIKVEKEGLYELSAAKLAELGFADISRVKVYGYGGLIQNQVLKFEDKESVTDDLEEVATLRKKNSIVFFAEGTIRWNYQRKWIHQNNTYSTASYYFLTEDENPLSIATQTAELTPIHSFSSIPHNVVLDNDAYGWYAGGNRLFDSYDFVNGNTHSYKVSTPDMANGSGTVQIGFSAGSALSETRATVNLGGSTLGTMTMAKLSSNESARETEATYNVTNLNPENTFTFTTTAGNSARLDFIRISYERNLKGTADGYSFTTNQSEALELNIADATANTLLWRIAYAGHPTVAMQGSLQNGTLSVPIDDPTLRYVIVDAAKSYPAPEIVGEIANQNLHADRNIDMVIIIPESGLLAAEAERLAKAHEELQNLRVKVVPADRIYNEFSSGTPDATAYRRYMKMLYDRAEDIKDAPRYLLLFGDCAWDNRMLTEEWKNYSPRDFLLCYENCEKINDYTYSIGSLYSYVTDDYFGLLDDGEGANLNREKIDLGIGRIPVHTAEDAKIFVDKTIDYLRNKEVGMWKNSVCVMGDNGDRNEHMEDAEKAANAIKEASKGKIDIQRMYWDAYPRTISATGYRFPEANTRLKEIIGNGAVLFNYSGHGSPNLLSHSCILTTDELRALSSAKMPMWVLASCEITPYDELSDNLGRATLINKNGGAVAVFCASRAVYASYNSHINVALSRYLFSVDETTGTQNSVGDAVRQAKVDMIYDPANPSSATDNTMNKLKYVLLGDPAINLAIPTGDIVIDRINGKEITPGELCNLAAGSKAVFSGYIVKHGTNTADENFSGVLSATLFDRAETVVCKNNDGSASTPMRYTGYTNALAVGSDSVVAGRFSVTLPVPVDISYSSDAARLSLYAVNNDHSRECNGYSSAFSLNGTAPSVDNDKNGPEAYIYLDEPGFPSGGTVGTSALFVAELSDESGINAPLKSAGHDMTLIIDDNATSFYTLNRNFVYDFGSITSGTVTYRLDNLSPGKHSLQFKVWDTAGNSTSRQLNFNVVDGYQPTKFGVSATKSPTRTQTCFIATVATPVEGASVRFEVYDFTGRRIWQQTNSSTTAERYFYSDWYLTNDAGAPVPAGVYLYRAVLNSPTGEAESKTKKIIVVKQ